MNTTIGVFSNHISAGAALKELKDFGVSDSNLSYVYTNEEGDVKDKQTSDKVGDGLVAGATTGAILGGIVGLVVANGILPGVGTLFVAGPLAAALGFTGATAAGVATGLAAGGLIGALNNFGVNSTDAALYENYVKSGDVVIIARDTPASVQAVFEAAGAMEVRQYTTS